MTAALCVSALIHAALPYSMGGGSRARPAVEAPRALSVRVLPQAHRSEPGEPADSRASDSPQPSVPPAMVEPPQAPESPRAQPIARAPSTAPAVVARTPEGDGALADSPDLTYYAAKQLDVYPSLSKPLDLSYGGKAAAQGVTGRALLLVLIDELGAVNDVSVVEAEPANTFEDDAKRALMTARFTPAYRKGRPVRSRVLIEVNYGVERGSP